MNRTKNLIFEAGIKAFAKKGFHKSTVDEIAETAGIAKGTLYYHFKSKEDIFKFIIDEGIKTIEDEIRNKTENIDNPIDKLKMVCKTQYQLTVEYREFFKTMLEQLWGDEERQFQIRNALKKYFEIIESYLDEAVKSGMIPKCNIEVTAYNFFGAITSTVVYSLSNNNVDSDELEKNATDFVMRGIGASIN